MTEGFRANRRDILRTATGLAAAAVVGGTLVDSHQVAAAPGTKGRITATFDEIGQFEVLAFSWGISNSGSTHSGGGGGAGKANFQDIAVTKYMDVSSPKLQLFTANGHHIARGTLVYTDTKGSPIFTYEFSNLIVTSVALGGSSAENMLTENVTFNFAKVKLVYGDSEFNWDIVQNQG